jgi:hypothetical protein
MDSGGRPVNAVLNPENFDPASFGQAPGNPEAQALTAIPRTLTPRLSTTPPAFSFCPPPAK